MNGQPTNGHHPQTRFQINTNTGVSVGIIVLGFAAFFTIMNVLSSLKAEIVLARTETANLKMELNAKIEKTDSNVSAIQGNKTSVTGVEFFRWAVHLQQSNPQIKVPEPEVGK